MKNPQPEAVLGAEILLSKLLAAQLWAGFRRRMAEAVPPLVFTCDEDALNVLHQIDTMAADYVINLRGRTTVPTLAQTEAALGRALAAIMAQAQHAADVAGGFVSAAKPQCS